MDAALLRSLQAPLKDRYRADPAAAKIPVHAVGEVVADHPAIAVEGWAGRVVAGLHPSAGGDGAEACSGDMLLQALVGCAGVTLKAVATAMAVSLRRARIEAHGHFDVRGTLGLSREAPVGLTDVRLEFHIDADADAATLAKLIELTERYCVVFQTLKHPPQTEVALVRG